MQVLIDKNKHIDVLLIAEGTYPFISGGVSTWIHELIRGLAEFNFGVVFLGSRSSDYGEIKYTFPENLVYLVVEYLFEDLERPKPKEIIGNQNAFLKIRNFLNALKSGEGELEVYYKEILDVEFYEKELKYEDFLYSKKAWELIIEYALNFAPEAPFINYFWTIRNSHFPIWIISKLAKNIDRQFDIIHSPSTGYAGLLASFLKHYYKKPFILTEHGIYIKERMIDLLSATWIDLSSSFFGKEKGEIDYIRKIWINFFSAIGKLIYYSADKIISLFAEAKKVQLSLGADPKKCIVIPNGVDIDLFSDALMKRGNQIPKTIGLVGRVTPIKDIKTFIKAMKITLEKLPEALGLIIGPTSEDPHYYEECKNLVDALGITEKIRFLGFQDVKKIYPKLGLLTLTSISEGMPLVVLEGFASGLPCVATDVGACRQLIYGGLNQEDVEIGKAGEIVPIGNPKELALAM